MSDKLVASSALGAHLDARTRAVLEQATREETKRAYKGDWTAWVMWCEAVGRNDIAALNPGSIAEFLVAQFDSGLSLATIRRRRASLAVAAAMHHRPGVCDDPVVRLALRGLVNSSTAVANAARPLSPSQISRAVALYDRDKSPQKAALLLVGWVTGARRSELTAMRTEHVTLCEGGYEIVIVRSKTDQDGAGRTVVVPHGAGDFDPVQRLREQLGRAGNGPLWSVAGRAVSDKYVDRAVKQAAQRLGFGPGYSAHSLRAGYITTAASIGVPEHEIALQSGHRSVEVLRGYIRGADRWRASGTAAVVRLLR